MEPISLTEPTSMVAEIEHDASRKNEEQCKNCDNRFRCWTNRTLVLSLERVSIEQGMRDGDKFTFSAKVPSCFQCGNMVGSNVKIHATIGMHKQEIRGIILGQTIRAEGTNPMELEVEGVSNFNK